MYENVVCTCLREGKERREEEEEPYRVEKIERATAANGWVSGCRVARRGRGGEEDEDEARRDQTRSGGGGGGGEGRKREVYSRLSPARMILNTIIII